MNEPNPNIFEIKGDRHWVATERFWVTDDGLAGVQQDADGLWLSLRDDPSEAWGPPEPLREVK